ncbi:hypothetical protein [Paenibacillus ihumii]|uniref:hypothetical protein n=1 Tax=Paenibacillus ihumii TaxID=687436 RepID=UPI0006D826E0|nr:hypothetical protein [Paenibacillus ihumii]
MPVRQVLVCSLIFLFITFGAALLARWLPAVTPPAPEQTLLHLQQLNGGLRNPASFQPREYIRIVPFNPFESSP